MDNMNHSNSGAEPSTSKKRPRIRVEVDTKYLAVSFSQFVSTTPLMWSNNLSHLLQVINNEIQFMRQDLLRETEKKNYDQNTDFMQIENALMVTKLEFMFRAQNEKAPNDHLTQVEKTKLIELASFIIQSVTGDRLLNLMTEFLEFHPKFKYKSGFFRIVETSYI